MRFITTVLFAICVVATVSGSCPCNGGGKRRGNAIAPPAGSVELAGIVDEVEAQSVKQVRREKSKPSSKSRSKSKSRSRGQKRSSRK
jgi:hypothetical protein